MVGIKPNFRSPQKAIEYSLYQAIGNRFRNSGPVPVNDMQEINRQIAYGEESRKNRESMDAACERFLTKTLGPRVPQGFWSEDTEVIFRTRKDGISEIIFYGSETILCVAAVWGGSEHRFHGPEVYTRS